MPATPATSTSCANRSKPAVSPASLIGASAHYARHGRALHPQAGRVDRGGMTRVRAALRRSHQQTLKGVGPCREEGARAFSFVVPRWTRSGSDRSRVEYGCACDQARERRALRHRPRPPTTRGECKPMGISLSNTTSGAGRSWPTWVRALVLIVGVAVSAAVGYLTTVAVILLAVDLGAAPLLDESTPQQPWVTPVSVGAGMIMFGLGVWFSARTVRRHPVAS